MTLHPALAWPRVDGNHTGQCGHYDRPLYISVQPTNITWERKQLRNLKMRPLDIQMYTVYSLPVVFIHVDRLRPMHSSAIFNLLPFCCNSLSV